MTECTVTHAVDLFCNGALSPLQVFWNYSFETNFLVYSRNLLVEVYHGAFLFCLKMGNGLMFQNMQIVSVISIVDNCQILVLNAFTISTVANWSLLIKTLQLQLKGTGLTVLVNYTLSVLYNDFFSDFFHFQC